MTDRHVHYIAYASCALVSLLTIAFAFLLVTDQHYYAAAITGLIALVSLAITSHVGSMKL